MNRPTISVYRVVRLSGFHDDVLTSLGGRPRTDVPRAGDIVEDVWATPHVECAGAAIGQIWDEVSAYHDWPSCPTVAVLTIDVHRRAEGLPKAGDMPAIDRDLVPVGLGTITRVEVIEDGDVPERIAPHVAAAYPGLNFSPRGA